MTHADPSHILQVGMGFWASKALLSAVELGVFTTLGKRSMTGAELARSLGLHARAIPDFPDTLVALRVLEREGEGPEARYSNTAETALFLDKQSPAYLGGFLEMCNARLYRFWGDLTEGLKTGAAQNEVKHTGKPVFAKLYEVPGRLEQFMSAMRGISAANFAAFAEKFDFSKYRTLCDVGGATGILSTLVARRHAHLSLQSFDLPAVEPIARRHLEKDGVAARVEAVSGDFLKEPLPRADVITMGMILHDWNLEHKLILIRKAWEALPEGGAFVAIENLIDDDRRENAFGLMMSLNMLIEFGDAFDYSGADFRKWCGEAGFTRVEVMHLTGPSSAAVAYK